jgi:coenzyme F420-reducing hydrogenase alpha subunit
MTERHIAVDYIARVEGEGALKVRIHNKTVEEVELRIFEPPRFFEGFLRGRMFSEAPDITARICGICPVAYQMSSCHAMEHALGIRVGGQLRELRRLLYCGEWIESHALHIYLLHAPDFLGYPDALRLAKDHPEVVKEGLELKKVGNDLMTLLGGREIHPINVRVGGFYRVPAVEELEAIRPRLERALVLAEATARFTATLKFPEIEEDYEFVSLRHPNEYPINEGEIVSSRGLKVDQERWPEVFEEVQMSYSNAYTVVHKGVGPYLVGPLARYALNHDRLSPRAKALAHELGLGNVVRNPFKSIIVRSIETVFAIEESLRILNAYRPPEEPAVPIPSPIPGGVGGAVTEAPRGMLYHGYRIAPGGKIEDARIVAPTTQNLKRMEDDVRHLVEQSIEMDDAHLTEACEHSVRNHDPCISCATHFLTLDIQRS